jgi:hypothetical protein
MEDREDNYLQDMHASVNAILAKHWQVILVIVFVMFFLFAR